MPRRLSSVGCRCAASGASLPFGVGPPPFFAALPFAPFFVADGCAGSGARIDGTRPGGEPSSLLLAAPNVATAVSVAVAAPDAKAASAVFGDCCGAPADAIDAPDASNRVLHVAAHPREETFAAARGGECYLLKVHR